MLASLDHRLGNKGASHPESATVQGLLQKVIGQAVTREELEAHHTLTVHAHHLPDHDTKGGETTPQAGARPQSHAGEDDHHQHRATIHGGVAEAEDIGEDTGDHPLLHPRTTGAVEVLTLSGIDRDEMTHD